MLLRLVIVSSFLLLYSGCDGADESVNGNKVFCYSSKSNKNLKKDKISSTDGKPRSCALSVDLAPIGCDSKSPAGVEKINRRITATTISYEADVIDFNRVQCFLSEKTAWCHCHTDYCNKNIKVLLEGLDNKTLPGGDTSQPDEQARKKAAQCIIQRCTSEPLKQCKIDGLEGSPGKSPNSHIGSLPMDSNGKPEGARTFEEVLDEQANKIDEYTVFLIISWTTASLIIASFTGLCFYAFFSGNGLGYAPDKTTDGLGNGNGTTTCATTLSEGGVVSVWAGTGVVTVGEEKKK